MGPVFAVVGFGRGFGRRLVNFFDFYFFRIGQTQCQFVTVYAKLHRVSHGSVFHQSDFSSGNDSHIENMLTQRTFAADGKNHGAVADGQVF